MQFNLEQIDTLLSTTRAVRRRLDLDRGVPDDILLRCIDLAEQAPSGGNIAMFSEFGSPLVVYDEATLRHTLEVVGCTDVESWPVGGSGDSRLVGLERHMRSAAEFNAFETIALEARRP